MNPALRRTAAGREEEALRRLRANDRKPGQVPLLRDMLRDMVQSPRAGAETGPPRGPPHGTGSRDSHKPRPLTESQVPELSLTEPNRAKVGYASGPGGPN
jgi:hypothetical protein